MKCYISLRSLTFLVEKIKQLYDDTIRMEEKNERMHWSLIISIKCKGETLKTQSRVSIPGDRYHT